MKSYSQSKIIRTYITKDSLTYITLLNNNKVGYIKYSGFSPITLNQRRLKNPPTRRCADYYIVNDSGYGNYEIKGDSILLKFVEHKVDSISVEILPYIENQKKITVTFKPKYEIHEDFPTLFPMVIKQEGHNFEIDNSRSSLDDVKIELKENDLPKVYLINNSQRVVVDKFQNQNITYLRNSYKELSTGNVGQRSFKIADLFLE